MCHVFTVSEECETRRSGAPKLWSPTEGPSEGDSFVRQGNPHIWQRPPEGATVLPNFSTYRKLQILNIVKRCFVGPSQTRWGQYCWLMFEYIQCWDDAGILLLNFGLVWNQKFHNLVLKVKNMMVLISKFACVCVVLECTLV